MATRLRRTPAPAARFDHLVVTETADEVLLYETEKHHIHHLNATTAAVWRQCDGQHTVGDLARDASRDLGAVVDEATVRLALTQLDDAGLLAQPLVDGLRMPRMSRRAFMQRAGVAGAIAVPAIVSTTAAVSAQSPGQCGGLCGAWAQRVDDFPYYAFRTVYECHEECGRCYYTYWDVRCGQVCADTYGISPYSCCVISTCPEPRSSARMAVAESDIDIESVLVARVQEEFGTAESASKDAEQSAAPSETVSPVVSIDPVQGPAGSGAVVSLGGFASGEPVIITWVATGSVLAVAGTDNAGAGGIGITVPIDAGVGDAEIVATGTNSGAASSVWFTVLAPQAPSESTTEPEPATVTETETLPATETATATATDDDADTSQDASGDAAEESPATEEPSDDTSD